MVTRAACPRACRALGEMRPVSEHGSPAGLVAAAHLPPRVPSPCSPSARTSFLLLTLRESPLPRPGSQVAPLHSKGSGAWGPSWWDRLGPCRQARALIDAATSGAHRYVSRSGPQIQGQSRRRPRTPSGRIRLEGAPFRPCFIAGPGTLAFVGVTPVVSTMVSLLPSGTGRHQGSQGHPTGRWWSRRRPRRSAGMRPLHWGTATAQHPTLRATAHAHGSLHSMKRGTGTVLPV